MNILCCFKLVNDLDLVMEKDWRSATTTAVDLSYAKRLINCYDEAGLETALRLKDEAEKRGESAFISAVTVGDGNYETFFKNLFAVGIDRILQIKTSANPPFAPDRISSLLFEAAKHCAHDVVITGIQSADGTNGLTPYLLAQKLKIPCFAHVTELRYMQSGTLRVTSDTGRGLRHASVNRCALYAVGNSVNPYLRMATLKRKLAVSKMSAELIEQENISNLGDRDVPVSNLSRENKTRSCTFITGESCEEKAKKLLKDFPEVNRA